MSGVQPLMTCSPTGGHILETIHACYARLVTWTRTFSGSEVPKRFYDVGLLVRGDRIDVSGHALPGIQALRRHVLDRATPSIFKKMHSKLQRRASWLLLRESRADHYAEDSLLGTRPRTTVPPRTREFLPLTDAFGPSTVEVRFPCGRTVEPMRGRIDHLTICACRPQLPALPFRPYSPA